MVLPSLTTLYSLSRPTSGNNDELGVPPLQDLNWYAPASTNIRDAEGTEKPSGTPDITVCSPNIPYPAVYCLIKWLIDTTVHNLRSYPRNPIDLPGTSQVRVHNPRPPWKKGICRVRTRSCEIERSMRATRRQEVCNGMD